MVREIITLQLGHDANFVGTHYWNTQAKYLESKDSEFNQEVLYRTGENYRGEQTYTPRLVICDLKGSLGTLRHESELYEPTEGSRQAHAWTGKMELFESDPIKKNQYLQSLDTPDGEFKLSYAGDLSKNVKVWSDFNSLYYHPTTVYELTTHTHDDENNRFLLPTRGREVYQELAMDETLMDVRIRQFMEESDNPQGFQIFANSFDGFSGVAAATLEYLAEDYPKKARIVYGIAQPKSTSLSKEQTLVQNINQALTLKCMSEESTLYIPMRAPSVLKYGHGVWQSNLRKHENMYEWSGYLAAAIETATSPFRLTNAFRLDMADLSGLLNPHAFNSTTALAFGLPLSLPQFRDTSLASIFKADEKMNRFESAWDLTLETPYDQIDRTSHCSFSVFRGIASILQHQYPSLNGLQPYSTTQVTEELTNFTKRYGPMLAQSAIVQTPFIVGPTFPQFFGPMVTTTGLIRPTSPKDTDQIGQSEKMLTPEPVTQCASYARLHSGSALKPLFEFAVASLKVSSLNNWVYTDYTHGQFGLDRSDFESSRETLQELCDAYGESVDYDDSFSDDN
ncbi:mtDNA inheritance, partitioning of the mitochondrial organelle [Batrachochytrium dendrobatidis]